LLVLNVGSKRTSSTVKTRAGTGRSQHAVPVDARLVWARRGRELYESVVADLGGLGRLSTAQEQLCRRLSGLCVVAESIEVQLAQGKMRTGDALSEYIGAINCLRRVAHSIGLRRVPKEIPDLNTYLHSHYGDGVEIEGEAVE
jgi:hypothetical protein